MKMQERECSNQGETLGMGFDSLKNILLPNSAIDLSNVNEDSIQSEQVPVEESCSFAHIENEAMLSKSLSLSANIDFKIGGEGSGLDIPCILSASAKGGYFRSVEMKENNLYILLNYQLKNTAYRITHPKLSAEAENILSNSSDFLEFRKKFGDEFIIGFRTGVEYTAWIEVLDIKNNEKEKTYLKINSAVSELLALLGIPTQPIDGNLQNDSEQTLKNYSSRTLCFKRPPNINESGVILTLDRLIFDFIDFRKQISSSSKKHYKYTAVFADYDQLVEVRHDILTPELKRLKSKLNRLRGIKIQKQIQLLGIQNQLRFQGQNLELNEQLRKLYNDVYELDDFMNECLFLPDSMTDERYKLYLNS